MYWNWHSIHNGYETYWKGLLSHDMDVNPTYEEAAVFGAEFKKLEKHLLHIKKKNKIALLVDNRSLTAFNWFPIDKDLSYNDVVRWMYDSLYELNLECDVVDSHAIEPEKYSMIVTPALYSADEKLIEKLDSFVKNGGVLVSSFKSFVADENLTVYDDAQPHGLTRCFGLTYNQFTNPGRTRVKGKPVQYFMELLKPEEAEVLANYEHRYWEKYAALTRNKYGNGVAYYIGGFLEKEELKKIYELAVSDAKIHQVFPSIQWPVIVRSGINGEGKKLHYIFNYSEDKQSVICPYEQVKDLLTGTEYKKDDTIILSDWNLVVLEE
jgi:beta-galactosidase